MKRWHCACRRFRSNLCAPCGARLSRGQARATARADRRTGECARGRGAARAPVLGPGPGVARTVPARGIEDAQLKREPQMPRAESALLREAQTRKPRGVTRL